MNGAQYDVELFTEIANAPTATQRERIAAEIATNADGDVRGAVGRDWGGSRPSRGRPQSSTADVIIAVSDLNGVSKRARNKTMRIT